MIPQKLQIDERTGYTLLPVYHHQKMMLTHIDDEYARWKFQQYFIKSNLRRCILYHWKKEENYDNKSKF